MPPGWAPGRLFGGWKKVAAKAAGFEAYWSTMGHYETLTPETGERIVDTILRATIMEGCESDDFYMGVLESHGDYADMQAYAAASVGAFWAYFWA